MRYAPFAFPGSLILIAVLFTLVAVTLTAVAFANLRGIAAKGITDPSAVRTGTIFFRSSVAALAVGLSGTVALTVYAVVSG